jgi:hypothetical protein
VKLWFYDYGVGEDRYEVGPFTTKALAEKHREVHDRTLSRWSDDPSNGEAYEKPLMTASFVREDIRKMREQYAREI